MKCSSLEQVVRAVPHLLELQACANFRENLSKHLKGKGKVGSSAREGTALSCMVSFNTLIPQIMLAGLVLRETLSCLTCEKESTESCGSRAHPRVSHSVAGELLSTAEQVTRERK